MNVFKRARLTQGLTQAQLAAKLGVSTVSVWQWEKGVTLPKVSRLAEVAAALGTTVPELLDGREQ